MAENPSETRIRSGSNPGSLQYWCYSCDKRVPVDILADLHDVVCYECKNGFIESISSGAAATPYDQRAFSDSIDDLNIRNQFLQVLQLIAAAREPDASPTRPSDPNEADNIWIQLDGYNNDEDDEDERSIELENDDDIQNRERDIENRDRSGGDDEEGENEAVEVPGEEDNEEEMRRRWRDELRIRFRDFASRAANRRNGILDWAEIFMDGLEDHSIDLRLPVPDSDTYIGNPGDYVDAAGYAALLQNLAENDGGGRRGAPPAAKGAVERLGSSVIVKEEEALLCAICKDSVSVGEIAKNVPCGHRYHGECIVTWLEARNSCPMCRFELPTDDLGYEEERKKRVVMAGLMADSSSSSGDLGSD